MLIPVVHIITTVLHYHHHIFHGVEPEAKCSNPAIGLTLLSARNPFRGNFLTTDNSHGMKPDRFSLNDNMDVEKVS